MKLTSKDVRSLPDSVIAPCARPKPVVVEKEATHDVPAREGFVGTTNTPADKPAHGEVPDGAHHGLMALRFAQLKDQHTEKKRAVLAEMATHAVAHSALAEKSDHPVLEMFGEALGKALGVLVTEALALVPSWNTPVLDANGKPVAHVEGAERLGEHDILKRHQEVVGPQITALVEQMPPGAIHDLLEGLGKGATEAPGLTYRLEVAWADALAKL